MKTKTIVAVVVLAVAGIIAVWKQQDNKTPVLSTDGVTDVKTLDMAAIRDFMNNPDLELSYLETGLPQPYFMVGSATAVDGGGENIEKVDGWIRQVNIYHQKELLNGQCGVYEYHVDPRDHSVTEVVPIRLKPEEIDGYKESNVTCNSFADTLPRLSKAEAEVMAMEYLGRVIPHFDQIKDQFTYSEEKMHTWLWEDKNYQLPEGLKGIPYSYPVIRMSVGHDKTIMYWNTVSLFEN